METIESSPPQDKEQEELRSAYNSAFSAWVSEVTLLQAYSSDPSVKVEHIADAKVRTTKAEREYRERRNQLARKMSSPRD